MNPALSWFLFIIRRYGGREEKSGREAIAAQLTTAQSLQLHPRMWGLLHPGPAPRSLVFCAKGNWKLLLSVVRIWHRCITEHGRDGHQKPRALRYFFWSHLPFLSHSPGEIVVLQHQLGWEGDDKRPRLGALPHKLCGCCFCACGQAGPFLMGVILLLPSRPSWALLGLCLPRAVPTCLHPCSVCIAGRAAVCEVSSKPTCLNQTPWCTGNCW